MMRKVLSILSVVWFAAPLLSAQAPSSSNASPGLKLLMQVASQYSKANSYDMAWFVERSSKSELSRSWQKTILTAASAPGGRYHFEGHSSYGNAVEVSDGKTVWIYHFDAHRYTAKPSGPLSKAGPIGMAEMPMFTAQNMSRSIAAIANNLKSAAQMPDETVEVSGKNLPCFVVRVQSSDFKRPPQPGYSSVKTVWIDKSHLTLVKTSEHVHTFAVGEGSHRPFEDQVDTVFTKDELDDVPDASLFSFEAPSDARLVAEFPDPMKDPGGDLMTGSQLPDLQLKSADGKVVRLNSLRGRPILLDLWATWCGPCIEALPQLANIAQEAQKTDLVIFAIDQDEDAEKASEFWEKKGYTWPDFHDGDSAIEKSIGSAGIPRTMLVDAQGKVVYDAVGMDDDALRTALARLGPEYQMLAPQPKSTPCVAAK